MSDTNTLPTHFIIQLWDSPSRQDLNWEDGYKLSDQEKGLFSHSNKFIYSEKRWYEFLRDYGKFLYKEIGTFFATTISLWAVAQILAIAGNDQIGLGDLAVPVLILASITSMYKAYIHQKRYVPESLKSESSITQKCFANRISGGI